MRRTLALALPPVVAGVVAAAVGACGGTEFVAGSGDGGPTIVDGSTDAPLDAFGPGAFCTYEAGTHTFCDDFDGAPLADLWPDIEVPTGGSAKDDRSIFVSSPNAFESMDPRSDLVTAGTTLHARIGRAFASGSQLVINFELHLDAVGSKSTGVGGTTLLLVTYGGNYSIGISAATDVINVYQDQTQADGGISEVSSQVATTPLVLGTWVKASLTINLETTTATASVNGTTGTIALAPPKGFAPTVYIGMSSRAVAVSVEAHYDNVTVDVIQ
jgi:hypothetical protein